MPIDTRLDGDPSSVRTSAAWLRDQFASTLDSTADSMFSVRNKADAGWDGPASDAFREKLSGGAQRAADMASAARNCGQAMETFAAELQNALDRMADARSDASVAGLLVVALEILEPEDRTEARELAYTAALHAAEAAREIERLAGETLKNIWADVKNVTYFEIGDLLVKSFEVIGVYQVSLMTKEAARLQIEATRYLSLAQSAPPGTSAAQIYRDFDWSRTLARNADELTELAQGLDVKVGKLAGRLGAGFEVLSIGYDIYNGTPAVQAIMSGGLGFGASVAAGAAIGTFIPVPVVGTVAGALGGAVVGIFTSGAVDTLYTEGMGSFGDAMGDGAIAVKDTGVAIGDVATGVWDAIF